MPVYNFKAKTARGQIKTGQMQAKSAAVVRTQLKAMRYTLHYVRENKAGGNSLQLGLDYFYYRNDEGKLQLRFGYQYPKTRDLSIFSRQFSSMLSSGVPLTKCLEILSANQELYDFKKSIQAVNTSIKEGKSLSEAMKSHLNIFPPVYLAMVESGESSGELDRMMRKLSENLEKTAQIISKTKAALSYPISVVSLAIIILIGMLVYIVPVFASQYSEAGQDLPALTMFVITLSNLLREHYLSLILALIAAFISLRAYFNTKNGKKLKDYTLLKMPIVGDLMLKIIISRWCYTSSTMLSSGVNILETLKVCNLSINNSIIEDFTLDISNRLSAGASFSDSVASTNIFPMMVVSMIAVGEKTGSLDSMLDKIAQIYEEETDETIKVLLSLIEPATIVLIGSVVGFIVLALYLPIFDMAKLAGGG